MPKKSKIDAIIAILLIAIGIILQVLPLFKLSNIKVICIVIFSLYSLVYLFRFILTKESKDYEGLHVFVASIIAVILSLILDVQSSAQKLYIILIVWIILMALIKLKKMDYFHDRQDVMWKVQGINLSLFIITGLLTCLNLIYSNTIQTIVIGFFMLIHGILELIIPVIKTLLK